MPKNLTWTQQQEESVTITMQVVVYPLQLRGQINSFWFSSTLVSSVVVPVQLHLNFFLLPARSG